MKGGVYRMLTIIARYRLFYISRTKNIHFWLEYKLLTFKIEYHYEES